MKPKMTNPTGCRAIAFTLLLAATLIATLAQGAVHYQRIKSFTGSDGAQPWSKLMEGRDRVLYGTTLGSGTNDGTVFRINRDGTGYKILRTLGSRAEVLQGSDGALYGPGFRLNKDGTGFQLLFGGFSYAGLVEGSDEALYGTTTGQLGGAGKIFAINKDGSGYRILYDNLRSNHENFWPQSALIEGRDGRLYGTSQCGGTNWFGGLIFRINEDGSGFTVLHNFEELLGQKSALMEASDGVLYGTTLEVGTLFRINKDGTGYAVLHRFGTDDDRLPRCQLVEGSDGALYGTTGANPTSAATVFRINKDGSDYTIIYRFAVGTGDGQTPEAGLIKGSDGAFYGTTRFGGDSDQGTIFKIWPPQTPDMISVTLTAGIAQVTLAGMTGYKYQILRSPDLENWSVLTALSMPPTGIYTYTDNNPPTQAAYYRAAWLP